MDSLSVSAKQKESKVQSAKSGAAGAASSAGQSAVSGVAQGAASAAGAADVAARSAGEGPARTGHVQLQHLVKSYGGMRALDDFSVEFAPGEMVVLLGPSGCGKTTALRVLTGLEQADSGTVVLDGADITMRPAAKRNMAMVFQQYSLFPHLTARENVEFGLRVRGVKRDERRRQALEALDMVGLSSQADKYTSQMSGGQQQRVALARALVVRPDLLALDEPLSALDAKVRVQLRDQIRHIQQDSGITTLFVTHDQEEALAVADRVGVMQAGKLVQIAAPRDIYERPANEFVANFIGVMNRLPARVAGGEARVCGGVCEVLPGSTVLTGEGTALVRPENVRLTRLDTGVLPVAAGAGEESAAASSHIRGPEGPQEGVVTGMTFLGSQVRVEVRLGGLDQLTAQVSAAEAAELAVGALVSVQVLGTPVLVV